MKFYVENKKAAKQEVDYFNSLDWTNIKIGKNIKGQDFDENNTNVYRVFKFLDNRNTVKLDIITKTIFTYAN